jgi:hypothetical protein
MKIQNNFLNQTEAGYKFLTLMLKPPNNSNLNEIITLNAFSSFFEPLRVIELVLPRHDFKGNYNSHEN